MIKTKLFEPFHAPGEPKIDEMINSYMEINQHIKVIDIKFSTAWTGCDDKNGWESVEVHTALLIYKEGNTHD